MKPTLALSLLLLTACATNPATGRSEFNIVSEQQELAMGKEAHEQVLREYGVYDEKPELNAMVDRIGHRIAASSPRPNLPWTFTLLDTPMVNAMALPGGYIYVTRGILERMNSEDELAGVMGHEVAHVAARHSAQSISRSTLAQAGLVVAAVAAGAENTERYGLVAAVGVGLLFTKYSRSQETQADVLGTDYMSGAGWNPHGSESMLQGLQRLQGGPTSGIERYFMDHPDPGKRVVDVQREIAKLDAIDASRDERPMPRDSFVRALDGVMTGNSTQKTIIRGTTAYNKTYGVVAQSPRGWKAITDSGSLFAFVPAEGQEVIYAQELTEDELRAHDTPRAAVQAALETMGLSRVDSERVNTFTIDRWRGTSNGTSYTAHTTQQSAGDNAVVLLHLAQGTGTSDALAQVVRTLEVGSTKAKIKAPRLHVSTSRRGDTWESLAKGEDPAELAHLNGFDYPSDVPAGITVKVRD
jgi:predicted Zn-dependent protease